MLVLSLPRQPGDGLPVPDSSPSLQRYKAVQYLLSNFVHPLAKFDFTSALLYKVRRSHNYTSDDHSQNWLMLCL